MSNVWLIAQLVFTLRKPSRPNRSKEAAILCLQCYVPTGNRERETQGSARKSEKIKQTKKKTEKVDLRVI